MTAISIVLGLALFGAPAKNSQVWQECKVVYGEKRVVPSSTNTHIVARPHPTSLLLMRLLRPKDRQMWIYIIETTNDEVLVVGTKNAIDINLNVATEYARSGEDVWVQNRAGKAVKTGLLRHMTKADLEEIKNQE